MILGILSSFGYFDWFIVLLLTFLNIRYWKSEWNIPSYVSILVFGVLFPIVLPLVSIQIEFEINRQKNNESFDSFTMLYTYLRFPFYWLLLIIQYIVLKMKG
jgi:hypothetical protein